MYKGYTELYDHISSLRVINTHCHHRETGDFRDFSLFALIENSYVSWCRVELESNKKSRENFLSKVGHRSYFFWLQKSLRTIYGLDEKISADNWDDLSDRIRKAHDKNDFHLKLLREKCGYERIVLDGYWNPGGDNGVPDLFSPTFRINMFAYSYNREVRDHNDNNALILYDKDIHDIDEFTDFMEEIIIRKKSEGTVALKSALPYDRGNDFIQTSKEEAQWALEKKPSEVTAEEIKLFQDYVFFQICRIAAEQGLPLQCHTGLGEVHRSRALWLRDAVALNPDTRFVLFHGSYPWTSDVAALVHRYPNVYADLCWLPIISPVAARRFLSELIEVGNTDRLTWGCDTWTSEESYGALLAMREVLAEVFAEKVEREYLNKEEALRFIDCILRENPSEIYGIPLKD